MNQEGTCKSVHTSLNNTLSSEAVLAEFVLTLIV